MIRLLLRMSAALAVMLTASGCTDIVEPNQLAFVLGTSVDYTGKGEVEISHQIVIPTQKTGPFNGGAGNSEGFIVQSATGRDVFEASQKIQRKLSRKLMTSHRALIAISEDYFNKNDASKLFDKLNRDPANNQRDTTVLIKGSAKAFLMVGHPMEHLSSIAAGKELQINGLRRFSTRQFIIDSVAEGSRPLVPALQVQTGELTDRDTAPVASLAGYAVLNQKLKVKGLLNEKEGSDVIWMAGKGTFHGITVPWKDGESQLSFRLTHLKRQLRSDRGNPGHIRLTVKAQAYLIENTTPLDLSETPNMLEVERYLNAQLQTELQAAFDKVQQWGTDVFGIGEYLHRSYPYWWKPRRADWDDGFKKIDVAVRTNVQLRSIGASSVQVSR